ncbi:hypothetical protein [Thomasclavelia cocleata]|uniref:hypothetical protein n=1 Tax=Thomasclavelia cocleata TaxID=69824 RepID=UPI0025A9805D|nr:hypothetical protein [Thomasclavelia cocleata]
MTIYESYAIFISILSLLLSILSLIFTQINSRRTNKIYYDQTEMAIRESISTAKYKVAEAIKNSGDNNQYSSQIVKVSIEELLNLYEEACAKYIDKKVDKKRFKKLYYDEIKKVVESQELKDYYNIGSKYCTTKKVYNKWCNLVK